MILPIGKNDVGQRWPQFIVVITASIPGFMYGISLGWPAPTIPKLLSEDFPFEVTSEEVSYISIVSFVSSVIGGFGSGLLDKIGRKSTIQLIAIPQLLSFICIVLSYQLKELLYVGRFISGIGEGMCINSIPSYAAEVTTPKIRGLLSSFFAIMIYSGMLFMDLLGSYASIRISASICTIFPVIFTVAMWRMPESPYYLLMKNREEEAEGTLRFLRWKNDVSEELSALKKDVMRQMSEAGSFKDVFVIESNRKALSAIIGVRFFQTFTGISAFTVYIQVLLKESSESLPSQAGSSIFFLIQLMMTVVTTFVVDKWGRKPLLLSSIGGCFFNLSILTVYFVLKEHTSVDVSVINWLPLVMITLDVVAYSMGLGMVPTIMTGEMFSASIKTKMVFIVNASYSILIVVSTKFYQATAVTLGLTFPFGIFGVLTLIGVIFIWRYIPETKGKSLEQVQQRLKSGRDIA